MYLKQLSKSEDFAAWRELWNDRVLPFLDSLRPVAGPGIRIDRKDNGTLIRAVPAAVHAACSVGSAGYDSYFKITLAEPTSGAAVVTIADGATGSDSYAVVNGAGGYTLPPYSETISRGALYFLKYTPTQYGSGGAIVSGATMAISSLHQSGGSFPSLPAGGTSGAYYYQLGRVIWSSGSTPTRVVQDHTAGVAQFNWFMNCYLG
jgi:hypothetical protein